MFKYLAHLYKYPIYINTRFVYNSFIYINVFFIKNKKLVIEHILICLIDPLILSLLARKIMRPWRPQIQF
jgi:hypothetical protein